MHRQNILNILKTTEDCGEKTVSQGLEMWNTQVLKSETANIVKESVENVNLRLDRLVVHVTDNASNAAKSAWDLNLYVNHQWYVARSLNLIVQKFIRWKIEDSDKLAVS